MTLKDNWNDLQTSVDVLEYLKEYPKVTKLKDGVFVDGKDYSYTINEWFGVCVWLQESINTLMCSIVIQPQKTFST